MFNTFVNTFPETSSEIMDKIEAYYTLLTKWNRSHNLVQQETLKPEIFEKRHLIDCWQLISCFQKDKPILDVGSGAGLPGILLSIAGMNVDLIESDMNKVSFLKNCKSFLELNCQVIPIDIYSVTTKYDQLTSRAFSQLNTLLTIQWNVSRETKGVFLKGENYLHEIEEAQKVWKFDFSVKGSLSSLDGKIIEITNVSKV